MFLLNHSHKHFSNDLKHKRNANNRQLQSVPSLYISGKTNTSIKKSQLCELLTPRHLTSDQPVSSCSGNKDAGDFSVTPCF